MRQARFLAALIVATACSDASTAPVTPDPACGSTITLRKGEVHTLAGAASVACFSLAASAESQEYLLVAANVKSEAGSVWTYQLGSAVGETLNATIGVDPQVASALSHQAETDAAEWRATFEDRLRQNERKLIDGRRLNDLTSAATQSRSSDRPAAMIRAAQGGALPLVGDVVSYRVGDAASSNFCSTYSQVSATVKAIGTRAIIAQDVTAPARGYTDEDFRALAEEFDQLIYPVDARWFGEATDVNADQHITILFTPAINRLSPPGVSGFVGGFFVFSDLLPRAIPSQQWRCDASNEQEIMYLFTPDPDGTINGNRHTVPSAREAARGTLAHELQHMINHGIRQSRSASVEATWLNEGLSHFAEEAVGRASRGYGDSRRLTWNDVLFELDDFDSFFRQNLLRLRSWMERPDLASPISQSTSTLAPRGAAWALVRYSIDQYSAGDAPAFVRALVAGPEVGVQNLEARARTPLAEIIPGYLIANFGPATESGAAARYRYGAWDMRDVMLNLNGGLHPLLVTPLAGKSTGQSAAGSGSYFTIARPASAAAASFRMRSSTGGAVEFEDARVVLLRVK